MQNSMYNPFVSAKAKSYEKILHLHLGYTYTIGFRGKKTNYSLQLLTLTVAITDTMDFCLLFLL